MPSPGTIATVMILAIVAALIVRHMWKSRKTGGCSSCGGCGGACGACRGEAAPAGDNKKTDDCGCGRR